MSEVTPAPRSRSSVLGCCTVTNHLKMHHLRFLKNFLKMKIHNSILQNSSSIILLNTFSLSQYQFTEPRLINTRLFYSILEFSESKFLRCCCILDYFFRSVFEFINSSFNCVCWLYNSFINVLISPHFQKVFNSYKTTVYFCALLFLLISCFVGSMV